MPWTPDQLIAFAEADDFRVSPFREDGITYGTPTFIWSVVTDGGLFIRAYSGSRSIWYLAACDQGAGRIHLAGRDHEVAFDPERDPEVNDRIDVAYRAKYATSRYLSPMISQRARAATLRVSPLPKT